MYVTNKAILQTKLNPPIIENNILNRKELIENVIKNEKARLTMITAPGGYGKTVLTYQIVTSSGKPFIWYHLDEEDNDPAAFLYFILKGLRKYIPDINRETLSVLSGIERTREGAYGAASLIIEEIEKIQSDKVYVVFDDFHVIYDKQVLDLINTFLKYTSHKIHVVINSRRNSGLDLTKLRVEEAVIEIDKESIRFSFDEFLVLLGFRESFDYQRSIMEKVYSKCEGWPLALHLFMKEVESSDLRLEDNFDNVQAGKPVFEFFIYQIYSRLTEEVRDFVSKISVLEEITPRCCSYITGASNAEEIFEILVNNNVFISRVSNAQNVYICHQMFRNFLKMRLGRRINDYNNKAGEFYYNTGRYEEAIEYFIKGGDLVKALEAFKYAGIEAVRRGRLRTAERWIDFFGSEMNGNKWLILAKSSVCLNKGMFDLAENYIKSIEGDFISSEDSYGYYILLVVKARIFLYRHSLDKCVEIADEVIKNCSEVENFTLYEAFMQKAYGLILKGDMERAIVTLELGSEIMDKRGEERLRLFMQRYLTVPYFLNFDYRKAVECYELYSSMSEEEINITECFSVDLYLARTYRDMGRLSESKKLMTNTIRKKKALGYMEDLFAVYYQFATLYRDLGEYDNALKYAELSEELFKAGGSKMEFVHLVKALEALVVSDMGDMERALKLIGESIDGLNKGHSSFMAEVAYHSAGIIYMRAGANETAREYLEKSFEMSKTTGLKSMAVICPGLMAEIYRTIDKAKSEEFARTSLTLAARQDYTQLFITDPETNECLAIGIRNRIEYSFVLNIVKKLPAERINDIIKRLVADSKYDLIYEFIKDVNVKYLITEDSFEEIAEEFARSNSNAGVDYADLLRRISIVCDSKSSVPKLIVSCFGTFRTYNMASEDFCIKWRTNKAKELLAYIVHNHGKVLITEKILADVWPDTPEEKARKLFYTNISHVRNVLELCGVKDNLIKVQSGYKFIEDDIYCDEWAVNRKTGLNKEVIGMYLSAGEYLEDIYSDWAIEKRIEYNSALKKDEV